MTLRRAVLLAGGLSIVAGFLLILLGYDGVRAAGAYLLGEGVVVTLFVRFERGRYRPRAAQPGRLRPTTERLVDPTSGQLLEVWEDPATGTREYRPVR